MLKNLFASLSNLNDPANSRRGVFVYIFSFVVISFAWWLIIVAVLFGNQFGVYAVRSLKKGVIALPIVFILTSFLFRIIIPKISEISQKEFRYILITCAFISLWIIFLFPIPVPVMEQQHSLQLISSGMKSEESQAALIEVRAISFLDGSTITLDDFRLSGDWEIHEGKLFSKGEDGKSVAEWSGQMPGGIILSLRHNLDAGTLSIIWNGIETDYDLYAAQSVTTDVVLQGEIASLSLFQRSILFSIQFLYFVGLLSILFIVALLVEFRWPNLALVYLFIGVLYAVIMVIFVREKFAYTEFSAVRVFRDTISYAETAGEAWISLRFWAGYRPFTYPLVLKVFGITADNYADAVKNADVVQFQYWLSVVSWAVLGGAFSVRMRKLWLMPFAFGFVLLFSLNLEISIWENLILTESISFSLFALLLAFWLFWDQFSARARKPIFRATTLAMLVLVTIFYIFTRESNQYFVVFGATMFPVASYLKKATRQHRIDCLAYLCLFFIILVTKNVAFNASNIWQIHIYDHLAMRILPDDESRDYFVAAGLPIDENLMQITKMEGYEYQEYLAKNAEMDAVREWINRSGVVTYMKYLLSRPLSTMLEPLRHWPSLLGGDNLEYHAPIYGIPTIPSWIHTLTSKVYPRSPLAFWGILGISGIGVFWYFATNLKQSAWLVVGILLVSLYPMLFIIWHGNPMEIERHAAQVGAQFRIMGWMAVLLLLDHLSQGEIVFLPNRNKNLSLLLHQLQE